MSEKQKYIDFEAYERVLKNRYMLIGYKDDENDTHTSTRTSTHASSIDIQPSSENVTRLVLAILPIPIIPVNAIC